MRAYPAEFQLLAEETLLSWRPKQVDPDRGGTMSRSTDLPTFSSSVIDSFRAHLLGFYDRSARDLPWRVSRDPYAIWVSEVMLQQTRVGTVVPYFNRWMDRFPTVVTLADAELDDVLKEWEGLGYYRRARLLHGAAQVVRDERGGNIPSTVEELRELPGVGAYTAGAVASIAFSRIVSAVDGNVRRVLSRVLDVPSPTESQLSRWLTPVVDPDRPGDFNQALMEFGATVCMPRAPACGRCPMESLCRARAAGTVADRPRRRARTAPPSRYFSVLAIAEEGEGGSKTLLVRRPIGGLLGGLWEFPTVEVDDAEADGRDELCRYAGELNLLVDSAELRSLTRVEHKYSHFTGVYRVFSVEGDAAASFGSHTAEADMTPTDTHMEDNVRWCSVTRLDKVALSRVHRKIAVALVEEIEGSTSSL